APLRTPRRPGVPALPPCAVPPTGPVRHGPHRRAAPSLPPARPGTASAPGPGEAHPRPPALISALPPLDRRRDGGSAEISALRRPPPVREAPHRTGCPAPRPRRRAERAATPGPPPGTGRLRAPPPPPVRPAAVPVPGGSRSASPRPGRTPGRAATGPPRWRAGGGPLRPVTGAAGRRGVQAAPHAAGLPAGAQSLPKAFPTFF